MKRLFVDCDDTLLIYDDTYQEVNPFGHLHGTPFTKNQALIDFMYSINENVALFIWSGGGKNYAQVITDLLGLDELDPVCLIKDYTTFDLVRPGDIVIDDQDINVPTEVWKPFDKRIGECR